MCETYADAITSTMVLTVTIKRGEPGKCLEHLQRSPDQAMTTTRGRDKSTANDLT
jgi:hypothetical protein